MLEKISAWPKRPCASIGFSFQKMDFSASDFIFHTGASSQRWETQPPARETLPSEPRFKEDTSFCTQRTLCWCRSRLCEERRFYWLWRLEWLPPSHQKRIFEVLQESSWGGCETSKILRWQFVAYNLVKVSLSGQPTDTCQPWVGQLSAN